MTDAEPVATHIDPATGFIIRCVRTTAESLAQFPWMGEYLWSAYAPGLGTYRMGVGDTEQEAIAKYLRNRPELQRKAA